MLRHRSKQTKSGKKDCTQFPPSRRGDHRRPPAGGVQKRAIWQPPPTVGWGFYAFSARVGSSLRLPLWGRLGCSGRFGSRPYGIRSGRGRKKREAEASLFALRLYAAGCGRKKGCRFVERRFVAVLCTAEATVGERKTALAGCFSLCAFFTPHHFARYSAAAIRVKITHASERAISSFGR